MTQNDCPQHPILEDRFHEIRDDYKDLKRSFDTLCGEMKKDRERYQTKVQSNFMLGGFATIFLILLGIVFSVTISTHNEIEDLRTSMSDRVSEICTTINASLHNQSMIFKDDISKVRADFRELKAIVELNQKSIEKRLSDVEAKQESR